MSPFQFHVACVYRALGLDRLIVVRLRNMCFSVSVGLIYISRSPKTCLFPLAKYINLAYFKTTLQFSIPNVHLISCTASVKNTSIVSREHVLSAAKNSTFMYLHVTHVCMLLLCCCTVIDRFVRCLIVTINKGSWSSDSLSN